MCLWSDQPSLQILWVLCKTILMLENLNFGKIGFKTLFLKNITSHTHAFCSSILMLWDVSTMCLCSFQKLCFFPQKFCELLFASIDPICFSINRNCFKIFKEASVCFDQSKRIFDQSKLVNQVFYLMGFWSSDHICWAYWDWSSDHVIGFYCFSI